MSRPLESLLLRTHSRDLSLRLLLSIRNREHKVVWQNSAAGATYQRRRLVSRNCAFTYLRLSIASHHHVPMDREVSNRIGPLPKRPLTRRHPSGSSCDRRFKLPFTYMSGTQNLLTCAFTNKTSCQNQILGTRLARALRHQPRWPASPFTHFVNGPPFQPHVT